MLAKFSYGALCLGRAPKWGETGGASPLTNRMTVSIFNNKNGLFFIVTFVSCSSCDLTSLMPGTIARAYSDIKTSSLVFFVGRCQAPLLVTQSIYFPIFYPCFLSCDPQSLADQVDGRDPLLIICSNNVAIMSIVFIYWSGTKINPLYLYDPSTTMVSWL